MPLLSSTKVLQLIVTSMPLLPLSGILAKLTSKSISLEPEWSLILTMVYSSSELRYFIRSIWVIYPRYILNSTIL